MKSRLPPEVLALVEAALRQYEAEVGFAPLAEASKRTYLLHADSFVRWLRGEFEPGGRRK